MADRPGFCPHCGVSLTADEALVLGEWELSPRSLRRAGAWVHLTAQEAIVLHSIAAARGRPVQTWALLNRAAVGEPTGNLVQVLVCRLRKRLPGLPIETVHGVGYRWTGPIGPAPEAEAA